MTEKAEALITFYLGEALSPDEEEMRKECDKLAAELDIKPGKVSGKKLTYSVSDPARGKKLASAIKKTFGSKAATWVDDDEEVFVDLDRGP